MSKNIFDLVPDASIKESELANIAGGGKNELAKVSSQVMLQDGCVSGICSKRINTDYCDGGAVCTSGIAG
ncbi:MAG: hypothetical protein IKX28_04090 [Bacteroidales bacterium]|nr:hypothetical protein [Bacteroidales bacterium]